MKQIKIIKRYDDERGFQNEVNEFLGMIDNVTSTEYKILQSFHNEKEYIAIIEYEVSNRK